MQRPAPNFIPLEPTIQAHRNVARIVQDPSWFDISAPHGFPNGRGFPPESRTGYGGASHQPVSGLDQPGWYTMAVAAETSSMKETATPSKDRRSYAHRPHSENDNAPALVFSDQTSPETLSTSTSFRSPQKSHVFRPSYIPPAISAIPDARDHNSGTRSNARSKASPFGCSPPNPHHKIRTSQPSGNWYTDYAPFSNPLLLGVVAFGIVSVTLMVTYRRN